MSEKQKPEGKKTQLVAFRITPADWLKYRRAARKMGWTITGLAQMCFEVHAEEELQAYEDWKVAEAQNTLEEYAKRHK